MRTIDRRAMAKWRVEHPEERKAQRDAYNRVHNADRMNRRRATKRGSGVEPYKRADIFARDGGVCHLCKSPIRGEFHIDHLIPISAGGPDTPLNVAVAHPSCNLDRGARGPAQLRLLA